MRCESGDAEPLPPRIVSVSAGAAPKFTRGVRAAPSVQPRRHRRCRRRAGGAATHHLVGPGVNSARRAPKWRPTASLTHMPCESGDAERLPSRSRADPEPPPSRPRAALTRAQPASAAGIDPQLRLRRLLRPEGGDERRRAHERTRWRHASPPCLCSDDGGDVRSGSSAGGPNLSQGSGAFEITRMISSVRGADEG